MLVGQLDCSSMIINNFIPFVRVYIFFDVELRAQSSPRTVQRKSIEGGHRGLVVSTLARRPVGRRFKSRAWHSFSEEEFKFDREFGIIA